MSRFTEIFFDYFENPMDFMPFSRLAIVLTRIVEESNNLVGEMDLFNDCLRMIDDLKTKAQGESLLLGDLQSFGEFLKIVKKFILVKFDQELKSTEHHRTSDESRMMI